MQVRSKLLWFKITGIWYINDYIPLIGPSNLAKKLEFAGGFGEIYVQAQFTKDNEPGDSKEPIIKEDIALLIKKEQEIITGSLKINVIHGRDIYHVSNADPYCEVHACNTKILTTDIKKKNHDPIWKKSISHPIKQSLGTLVNSVICITNMIDER